MRPMFCEEKQYTGRCMRLLQDKSKNIDESVGVAVLTLN